MAYASTQAEKVAEADYWQAFAKVVMPGWRLYGFGRPRRASFLHDDGAFVAVEQHMHEIIVGLLGDRAPEMPEHWRK